MRLVVVGASLAGLRAVEAARRAGFDGELVLVGAEAHLPYDRPPLSKAFLVGAEPAVFRTDESFRDELDVRLLLGTPASALDVEARTLTVGDEVIGYDALVLATGASPRSFPGDDLDGVHHLRTLDDALAIRAGFDAGARLVVIGAGLIGSEIAASARGRGLDVTVLEAADLPMTRSIGPEVGQVLADLHRAQGVDLRLGVTVDGLESVDGRVTGVTCTVASDEGAGRRHTETLEADLVVVATGVAPATGWLAASGLTLHERDGGVVTDPTLQAAPGVWAAGDVLHARLENWTAAANQGMAAAKHAVDPDAAQAWDDVSYFWSDWYDRRIQMVGTADADEVLVVDPGGDGDDVGRGFLALYRRGDQLVGALSIDRPREIMKFRKRIVNGEAWSEVLDAIAVAS